jgi:CRP/FNR family transcriptional regulator, cyclic AMP receptor protein
VFQVAAYWLLTNHLRYDKISSEVLPIRFYRFLIVISKGVIFMNEDMLARVDLFSTLDKKELQELGRSCQERSYKAGSTILSQGETGVGLYVIKSGKVRILQAGDLDKAETDLGTFGPGDVTGEMALLDDLPRSASVVALEDVTALVLPVWEFRGFLRGHPDVALKLLGVLSRRLRRAQTRTSGE